MKFCLVVIFEKTKHCDSLKLNLTTKLKQKLPKQLTNNSKKKIHNFKPHLFISKMEIFLLQQKKNICLSSN